jgi:glycosyltransferase involved in cell wall biosynthesis
MLFSVIIPAYNRENLIAATLRSVLEQDDPDYEIIVVDDGSTDRTVEIVEQFGSRVRLIKQVNQGPGPARNLGAVQARGEYLAFVDSDDLWFHWTLSVYREVIEKNHRPSFICKAMIEFSDLEQLRPVRREPLDYSYFEDYFASVPERIFVGAGMAIIRRESFFRVGGFASAPFYGEDVDLGLRLGCEPGFVKIHAPSTLAYRLHSDSSRTNNRRVYDGFSHVIDQERKGNYPGGGARRTERRALITMHTRPASLQVLKSGLKGNAWDLYNRTAFWNLWQLRLRYLLFFPLLVIGSKRLREAVEEKHDFQVRPLPQGKCFFTVIIPTYNRSAWLRQTLDSIFQQEFTDYEVIVVDDGSTDNTREMLQEYGDRITLLTQKNGGPGLARNRGAGQAQGQYLAFLDSDDLWFPWTLATYARVAREHGWPSFIAGEHFLFNHPKEMVLAKRETLDCEAFGDYLASSKAWSWYGVSSFVVRRDEFWNVHGFSERWINGEDADFALRMSTSPGFITVKSPVTFAYRRHGGGEMSHFYKTFSGVEFLIEQEKSTLYSGGKARKRARIEIITRHARPVALHLLSLRMKKEAWRLYRSTFLWHFRLRRWKFLGAFPLKACFSVLR